jgi:hypothetical protein
MSLLAILIVGGVLYGFYLKPKYEGVQLKSIQDQTTVYFDDFGVPHIYANNSRRHDCVGICPCSRSFVANGINATNSTRSFV